MTAGMDAYIEAGRRAAFPLALTLYAAGALPPEYVEARFPEFDIAAALNDPETARRVELLSAIPAVQTAANEMVARRNTADALRIMQEKLSAPDCSAGMAREIAELSLKQAGKGDAPKYTRHAGICFGKISAETLTGTTEISTEGREYKDIALDLVRAMRCIDRDEVRRVLGILNGRPVEFVTLSGW